MQPREIEENMLRMKLFLQNKSREAMKRSQELHDYEHGQAEAYSDSAEQIQTLIDICFRAQKAKDKPIKGQMIITKYL